MDRKQIDNHKVPNTQMTLWLEKVEKHVKMRIVDLKMRIVDLKRKVQMKNPKVILKIQRQVII